MKKCASCGCPNPERLAECYRCGERFNVVHSQGKSATEDLHGATRPTAENSFAPQICDVLLKEATAQKKVGNWAGAIRCLRDAYAAMAEHSTQYPFETFLRLPMYLHQAGRSQEAWQEFQQLFTSACRNPVKTQAYFDVHALTDKMRLCLQRDKHYLQAAKYGVISYLCRAHALYIQTTDESLRPYVCQTLTEYISPRVIAGFVNELMKKEGSEGQVAALCSELHFRTLNLSVDLNYSELAQRLDSILGLKR